MAAWLPTSVAPLVLLGKREEEGFRPPPGVTITKGRFRVKQKRVSWNNGLERRSRYGDLPLLLPVRSEV